MKKMLKKLFALSLLFATLSLITVSYAKENATPIRILMNNTFVECDQPPVLIDDRTIVPLRAIFEALGATVDWNNDTQTVTSTKGDTTISLTINSSTMYVNGAAMRLDVPAQIISGRTMVPVRAIAEAFDCTVSWNGYCNFVIITAPNQQPYKIEAVNTDGEIVATAHFNEKGQLSSIEKDSVWFMPLIANINGNSYIDIFWRKPQNVNFTYDGNNISEISFNDNYHSGYKYLYNTDNCVEAAKYFSDSGTDPWIDRTYDENKMIRYRKYFNGNSMVEISLNNWGLTQDYNMSESGGSGGLKYNDNGIATCWFGGPHSIDYSYDSENKLVRAKHKIMGEIVDIADYRYINE